MTPTQHVSLVLTSLAAAPRVVALLVAALFGTVLLGEHGRAHADAIMGPPEDCVPGAIGRSSHAGQWCTTTTCNADADCAGIADREAMSGRGERHNYTCRAIDLCVRSETYQLGGRRSYTDPARNTGTREIASSCTPSCAAPGSCTHEKRCVRTDVVAPPAPPAPVPPPATPPSTPPPATPPNTVSQGSATPPAASREESSDGCAISPGGSVGSALVVLGALALLGERRTRRNARRVPPR